VLEKHATRGINGEANYAIDLNVDKSIDMEKKNKVKTFTLCHLR
jgi:hypothetical protein